MYTVHIAIVVEVTDIKEADQIYANVKARLRGLKDARVTATANTIIADLDDR